MGQMMPFINIIVIAGLILVVVFFCVLFLMPTERRGKKRKRLKMPEDSQQKDWKQVSLRLEKHVYALRHEIEGLQKSVRNKEKQALIEKAKSKKLQEIHCFQKTINGCLSNLKLMRTI